MSEQEKKGIKEFKEVLSLVFAIAMPILKEAKKDGFQWSDIFSFLGSEEFKNAVGPAFSGISEIPAEIADLSLAEGVELVGFILDEVKKLVA